MSKRSQPGSPAPVGDSSDHGNCDTPRKRRRIDDDGIDDAAAIPDDDGIDDASAIADDDGPKVSRFPCPLTTKGAPTTEAPMKSPIELLITVIHHLQDKHPFDFDLKAMIYDTLFTILNEDKTIPEMIKDIAFPYAAKSGGDVATKVSRYEIKKWVENPRIDVLGLACVNGPKCVKCQLHLRDFTKMLEEKTEEMEKKITKTAVKKSCDVVRKSIDNEATKMKGIRRQVSKASEELARVHKDYEKAMAEIQVLRQQNRDLMEKNLAQGAEIIEIKALLGEIQARL
ncbi:hypothetical protein QBC47DRAFT_404582 [Echria macrotheca]|uniref:Uncharacterized protein n=1 Tax=Echria macrotheca TaxID=438768 RepID=A0AAJ0F394_9PEZI|nr:hypothetical protein QBC47DRAFT_404582 [Echria macrotheca]